MIRIVPTLFLSALLALVALWAPCPAQGQETFRILVVVNGTPVTNLDLEERLDDYLVGINAQLAQQGRDSITLQQLKKEKKVTDRILEQFIDEILLQKEIERHEISVSEEELDARIQALCDERGLTMEQMEEKLAETGETLKGFREQLHKDLLKHLLIRGKVGKKIVVTDSEVMEEYRKQASIQSGVLVHLGYILLPPEVSVDDVLGEIDNGDKTFAEAADEYSVGPGMGEGGDLGWLDMGDLAGDWRDAVADLEPGGISEPFDVSGQTALIMLVERKQGEPVVDDNLKEQIYEQIREEKFQEILDEYLATIRTQALVQYKSTY